MLECGSNTTVSANTFDSNDGDNHGGGIVNNLFVRNYANGATDLGGGAIHAAWGSLSSHCEQHIRRELSGHGNVAEYHACHVWQCGACSTRDRPEPSEADQQHLLQ